MSRDYREAAPSTVILFSSFPSLFTVSHCFLRLSCMLYLACKFIFVRIYAYNAKKIIIAFENLI